MRVLFSLGTGSKTACQNALFLRICNSLILKKGVVLMKRVKAACILQTLVFSQKPEFGLTPEEALKTNREEFARYKESLERTKTRYMVTDMTEQEDGAVVVHVKKQYNNSADVSEYFD